VQWRSEFAPAIAAFIRFDPSIPEAVPAEVEPVAAEIPPISADIPLIAADVGQVPGHSRSVSEPQIAMEITKILPQIDAIAPKVESVGTNVSSVRANVGAMSPPTGRGDGRRESSNRNGGNAGNESDERYTHLPSPSSCFPEWATPIIAARAEPGVCDRFKHRSSA